MTECGDCAPLEHNSSFMIIFFVFFFLKLILLLLTNYKDGRHKQTTALCWPRDPDIWPFTDV